MKASTSGQDVRRKVVGRFLRDRRVKAGLTQWDIASHLRYSTAQFVSNWERGVSLPPVDSLPKLVGLLGVSGQDIIGTMHQYQEQMLKLDKKQVVEAFRKSNR